MRISAYVIITVVRISAYVIIMICLVQAADVSHSMRSPYITSGYRPTLSLASCVRSILVIHNETVNIWTHLLGFCYFFWQFFDNLVNYQDRDQQDWNFPQINYEGETKTQPSHSLNVKIKNKKNWSVAHNGK